MIGILLLFCPAAAFALDPTLRLSQYNKPHWQVEDGLPQNYVTSLAQTPEGYLLVGTSGGVARFDGVRFTPIVLDEKTGITREWITAVHVEKDGAIWIASRDAGMFLHRGVHTVQQAGWPARLDTLAGEYGLGGGLWRREGEAWHSLAPGLGPADLSWQGVLPLRDGPLLAATTAGLMIVGTSAPRIVIPANHPAGRPLSLAPAHNGGLWLGTAKGLFRLASSGRFTPEPVPGVSGPVVHIVEDRDGALWAATWGHGLYRLTRQGVDHWTLRDGLPDDFVHTLLEDAEGSLWIGTRSGLSRWTSGPVVPFGPAEGLDGQFFSAITGGPPGTLWLGTWRSGLYRVRDGVITKQPLPAPELSLLIRTLAVEPGGALWAGTWGGLFRASPGGAWVEQPVARSIASQINALQFDHQGRLWLAAAGGLYQYSGPSVITPPVRHLAGLTVNALLPSQDRLLWAGTTNGLYRVENGQARQITGLPHRNVTSLSEDASGRIWITTRGNGISLAGPHGVRTFDERHGLPPLPFFASLDGGESLWLSSPAGIFEIPFIEIEELLAGHRSLLEPIPYGQHDGLRTIECQNTGQPSAWKDKQGDLWFPTVRGVVRIRPGDRPRRPAPRVVIESLLDEPGRHQLHYTATRLSAPHRVEFRYRMEDSNPAWLSAGDDRVLQITGLRAGRHRLLLAARERGGPWGEPSVIELFQPPRYYETWWFRSSVAAASLLLLWLLDRWRVYLLSTRYAAVLAERNRIAREWHDTLLAGFAAISWQLDATLARLRDRPDTAASTVEVAQSMLQHYRAEARRVIWDLRSDQPELESLPSAISRSLQEMACETAVTVSVETTGEPFDIPGEPAQDILRICQEAAANAIRHAAPSRIDVHLTYAPGALTATVRDDGTGFHPTHVPAGHFGLLIMRERAQRFGGEVTIESTPGGGTIVSAHIPIRTPRT